MGLSHDPTEAFGPLIEAGISLRVNDQQFPARKCLGKKAAKD
jgi:hypothetical protein